MLEHFWYFLFSSVCSEDLIIMKSGTGYASAIDAQVRPLSLHPSTIVSHCTEKLAVDFKTMRSQVKYFFFFL
jgi:hypothetical protein